MSVAVLAAVAVAASAVAVAAVVAAFAFVRRAADAQVARAREAAAAEAELQKRLYAAAAGAIEDRFRTVAQKVLDDRSAQLDGAGAKTLGAVVEPLGRRLAEYERKIDEFRSANEKLGQLMQGQLSHLFEFARQAQRYTDALVGGSKAQGVWGENILRRTLEASGLKEGEHFELQRSQEGGIPDAWIYDVRNRHVVYVDAKTNIKNYLDACGAADDRQRREQAMREHARSLRRQIDGLASRNYAAAAPAREGYTALPIVGMFCPSDTVLEAALSADPQLMQYAYDKGVALVTPLTLLSFLWLVSWGWKQKAVEREFDEIRDQGRKMVEAIDLLYGDVKGVASALRNAVSSFESLEKRLDAEGEGRTSIRRIAEKLVASGAAPVNKALKNIR